MLSHIQSQRESEIYPTPGNKHIVSKNCGMSKTNDAGVDELLSSGKRGVMPCHIERFLFSWQHRQDTRTTPNDALSLMLIGIIRVMEWEHQIGLSAL